MSYLVCLAIFLGIIIISYIFFLIIKPESKFWVLGIHTLCLFIANIIHFTLLRILFIPSKSNVINLNQLDKGIDFTRDENIFGITFFDSNDVKFILITLITLASLLLLKIVDKENNSKDKTKKVIENVVCVAAILLEFVVSAIIKA